MGGASLNSGPTDRYFLDIYIFPEMSMTMLFYCKVTSHRPHTVRIERYLSEIPL